MMSEATTDTQLSDANDWSSFPGSKDVDIYWNQYFYNCTNMMEVVYTNAKPTFQEFGPYVYLESNDYTDMSYTSLSSPSFDAEYPAVNTIYNQSVTFESDVDGSIDKEMYLTNQAMFAVWYQKNAVQANDTQW